MLNRLYQQAYILDPIAADAIWEEWWSGDLTDFAVGWAWWNVAAELISNNDQHEHIRGTSGQQSLPRAVLFIV
jgi:hypothetical protein